DQQSRSITSSRWTLKKDLIKSEKEADRLVCFFFCINSAHFQVDMAISERLLFFPNGTETKDAGCNIERAFSAFCRSDGQFWAGVRPGGKSFPSRVDPTIRQN